MIRSVLPLAILATMSIAAPAIAYETDVEVRDPSTIVKAGGTYWIYGTGHGVSQFSSKDRKHWTFEGPVFATPPAWLKDAVPDNKNGVAWAPDIRYFNGLYHLYIAYSTIGSKRSAISLAVNKTLDPKGWTDAGVVVASSPSTDFNAIDPSIFVDADGKPWLSFGSYFGGIKVMPIDPSTGLQSTTDRTIYPIAEHPQSSANSIEASAVYFHRGYYYLFVNWDACCAGSKSTYNIRVGRSKSVTGPFVDKAGKDMMLGGGTLFLGSIPDTGAGLPFDDEVGPGHAAILPDTDGDWFSCHYEWAGDKQGATTVNVMKLTWVDDGWPAVDTDNSTPPLPSGLTYKISNQESDLRLFASRGDLLQETDDGTRAEIWRIDGVENSLPFREGQWVGPDKGYRVEAIDSGLCLTAPDDAKPGDKVKLQSATGSTTQLWSATPLGDGYYRFQNKASGLCLDNPGGSHEGGQPIGLWRANGQPPQAWRLEIQPNKDGIVPGALYKLVQVSSNLCLDDPDGTRAAGTVLGLWTDNAKTPQRWRISTAVDGSYTILSQAGGRYAGQASNELVFEENGLSARAHWKFAQGDDGSYRIVNQSTGHVLGTLAARPQPGAKLELNENGAGDSWRWHLVRE